MPHYFVLGQWTEQGVKSVKDSPRRAEAAKALAAKLGGKMDVYYTMGKYDFIAVAEAPNDEVVMQIALTLGSQGNVRTTTLKAWSAADGAKVIAKVP